MNILNKFNLKQLSIIMLIALTGCSALIPHASPKKTFILAHKSEIPCPESSTADLLAAERNLSVEEKETASIYKTNKILFQNSAELGYYQYAEWSESLTDRLGRLIKETLRCKKGRNQDGRESLEKLEYSILRFVHELPATDGNNGSILFSIRISLVISDGKTLEKTYNYSENLNTYDVDGAVEGSSVVTEHFLADLKQLTANFD